MNIERTPLYFGRSGRSLFGCLHAPVGEARDLAIVLCPALGHESTNAHRSVRHLADALARAGIPALRFDYDGTGDSAGQDDDPQRVSAWRESIRDAMQTLRELTQQERIGLIGVRIGATLATSVAAEEDIACLVSWGGFLRGKQWLRELRALQLIGGGGEGETFEPGGFLITEETQRDLEALDVKLLTIAAPVLRADAPPEMFSPPHSAIVPHETITEIVNWIATHSPLPAPRGEGRVRGEPRASHECNGIRETAIRKGPVFGILTEPNTPANAPLILLPNAGATHHAGPNRLYVFLARALAQAGFRSLRFDLPGLGDSVIDDLARENDVYPDDATATIAQLTNEPCVIAGLCSGAHAAFHAALEIESAPIVEAVLINPLTFYYERGLSLDQPLNRYGEWQWYMRSMRKRERWMKLLRGQVRFRDIARVALRRVQESFARKSGRLAGDLRRIAASGRKLTFIFSRFDPGHELLMAHAARDVKRLKLSLWRIDDADHTFEVKHSRDVMIGSLVRHLSARYLR